MHLKSNSDGTNSVFPEIVLKLKNDNLVIFTDHILNTREENVFTAICLPTGGWVGVPSQQVTNGTCPNTLSLVR